jgi:hypothetical protein
MDVKERDSMASTLTIIIRSSSESVLLKLNGSIQFILAYVAKERLLDERDLKGRFSMFMSVYVRYCLSKIAEICLFNVSDDFWPSEHAWRMRVSYSEVSGSL